MLRPPHEATATIASPNYKRAWICSALLGASWSSHFELAFALELARSTCAPLSLDPNQSIREAAIQVLSSRSIRGRVELTPEGVIMLAEHAERTWTAVRRHGDLIDLLYEEMHTGG